MVRNTITNLYNAVSAPVAATGDALASRLESVRETATLLYERGWIILDMEKTN